MLLSLLKPFPIKGLPTTWFISGDPKRCQSIATHFNSSSTPVYNNGYVSIWIMRKNAKTYGIISCGMGKPSIQYALERLRLSTTLRLVVRLGTAGGYDNTYVGSVVSCTTSTDVETRTTYHSSFSINKYQQVTCNSTNLFNYNYPATADVEDMETSMLFQHARTHSYQSSSLLLVNNLVNAVGHIYPNDAFYDMVHATINTINYRSK